jgi:hypothetical protein
MFRLLTLAGLAAGAFFAYKRFTAPREDEWDDETMYGSAEIHQAGDAQAVSPV